jgi:NhaA family Na+:H+ antiporter
VTWIVLVSLVIGKPLGISLTTAVAGAAGFPRAEGLSANVILVTGIAAGIGFTVALFFATAAFPPGALQDQAKMGALLSFLAAPIAIAAGRYLKLKT